MRQYFANITPVFPDPVLYTPDFGYMDKMLQRKQAQYDKGFAQLSSVWQQISRPTTNPENAKKRDEFLKQAKENLKNLSTMDLSDFRNVQAAMKVFEPYGNNTELIGDQEFTSFLNEQENIAEGYRTLEGGKYFNEENLNDIRTQRAEFAAARPSDWQKFYQNKRAYTPYYNSTDEYIGLMDKFKPSSVTTIDKNGVYITSITDKSWYKEDIQRYLDGTLSAQAKQQWGIEARNRAKADPEGIKKLFLQETKARFPAIDKELDALDIRIIKAKTEEERIQLTKNKEYFKQLKTDLAEKVSKIEKGDQNYINANLENFARSVYINGMVDKISNAYAKKDINQKIDYDEWLIAKYKESQANYRAQLHEEGADRRALWNLQGKEQDGTTEAPDVTVPTYQDDSQKPKTALEYQKEAEDLKEVANQKRQQLVNHIRGSRGSGGDQNVTDQQVHEFIAANKNSSIVKEYAEAEASYDAINKRSQEFNRQADDYARNQMGANDYNILQQWKQQKNKIQREKFGSIAPNPGENKIEWNGSTWLLKDPSGKVIADKGKFYFEKHNGISQADLDRRFSQTAAGAIASSNPQLSQGFLLENEYNQLRNNYLNQKQTVSVKAQGKAYSENVATFKAKKAEVSAITNLDANEIVTITSIPNPKTGLDMEIKVKQTKQDPLDDKRFENIKNSIETRNPGAKVISYNGNEGSIFVSGLGAQLQSFSDINIYRNVNPAHREQIVTLTSWRGTPNSQLELTFPSSDINGEARKFNIRKVIGSSPGINDMYMLINPEDNKNISPGEAYRDVMIPYNAMAQLLQYKDLDNVLINIKNKNSKIK